MPGRVDIARADLSARVLTKRAGQLKRQDRIDSFGAASLTVFALFLAFNQILIKFVNGGLQPIFFAGLRSAIAVVCIGLWMTWRGRPPRLRREMLGPGLAIGLVFSVEFICLFIALDLTTVTRTSIILYSMPVWMAIGAHFTLANERVTTRKSLGLVMAFSGVTWALLDRGQDAGTANLVGDLLALGAAICWAAIALIARGTRLRESRPEMQLFWQVLVSAPVLIVLSPLFGPLIRDLQMMHVLGLLFQGVVVVAAGFMFWLWLLSVYPAAGVASFSFMTPVFGVALGWLLLDEPVGPTILMALALVATGIVLINRPAKPV